MKKIITLSCLMLLCSFAGMAQKFALHGIYIEEYSGLRNDQ